MGRMFKIVDEAEEYQRGYNQRESDDRMLEKAFKEGCEHGYKKAMREIEGLMKESLILTVKALKRK